MLQDHVFETAIHRVITGAVFAFLAGAMILRLNKNKHKLQLVNTGLNNKLKFSGTHTNTLLSRSPLILLQNLNLPNCSILIKIEHFIKMGDLFTNFDQIQSKFNFNHKLSKLAKSCPIIGKLSKTL